MQGINLKIILLHSLVVLLAAHAFIALGYIYDVPLAELYLETGNLGKFETSANTYQVNSERISKFMLVQRYAPYAGALFAVALSFIALRRKKFGMKHTLIVLVIAALLAFGGVLEMSFLRDILFAPGRLVSASVMTVYTFNYLLLLGLSFWLAFLSKRIPGLESKNKV
ncbi:hypothetical protein K3G39_18530 [Pontibacter sp. HSC-14F20]|uniref:hypothetical protein n=1 Tax=Pontibacter sp. HSC-14F20 TaxID=2864136 RepID=UPI001C730B05|nr:hypothetical protein [Pontibacter sp. HSC-14F20]MBX0335235.1 hypothetical protein [Pontibacter sp. HSC-14F20]